MKTIAIPCEVDGKKVPIQFHVGEPQPTAHPIGHQAAWLGRERGVYVPQEAMDSMEDIHSKAKEMNIPFEELVTYALELALKQRDSNNSSSSENNDGNKDDKKG